MPRHRERKTIPFSPTLKRDLSGIYYLLLNDSLVYVGQSSCIWKRIGEHIAVDQIPFDRWFYLEIRDPAKRARMEQEAIFRFRPRYNREWQFNQFRGRRRKDGMPQWKASAEAWNS